MSKTMLSGRREEVNSFSTTRPKDSIFIGGSMKKEIGNQKHRNGYKRQYDLLHIYKSRKRKRDWARRCSVERKVLGIKKTNKYSSPKYRKIISQIHWAVKSGRVKKPKRCMCCGTVRKLQGHHKDYSKPFEVMWLCCPCHSFLHARIDDLLSEIR